MHIPNKKILSFLLACSLFSAVPLGNYSRAAETTETAKDQSLDTTSAYQNLINTMKSATNSSLILLMRSAPNQEGSFIETSQGAMFQLTSGDYLKNGWAKIKNQIYYFDKNGYRKTGWLAWQKKWYYLKKDGTLASNLWVTNGSQRWYVQEDGTRATGFVKYKKYTYYFNSFGSMVKGLRVINGKIYFFRENGTMATGWKCLSKKVYYFTQDGSAATGWTEINGSWYYFSVNGVRVANRSIDGNYLGPNGKRVTEKQIESRHKIFCGDSRTMQLKKAVGSSETSYVYKYGRGYNWFVNEGILELKKLLLVYPQSDVILNFGVNDLGNISKYIQIYQELINTYPKAHFYVMAVNPVDDVKYPSLVQRNKTTKLVTIFNSLLKSAFPDCYIDTYSYLESSGYETLDGCHYTTATYLKIYHYTLSEIQKKSGNS